MSEKETHQVVHLIYSTTVCLHHIEQMKFNPIYKQRLKKAGNEFRNQLMIFEKLFDEFDQAKPDTAEVVYNTFYDFLNAVAKVQIPDMEWLTNTINDYYNKIEAEKNNE